MKKIIFIGILIGIYLYATDDYIKPDKTYTMICKDTIVDINFAKNSKQVLYDSSKINQEKPLFNMGINYCKIDNHLYLSAGETFKYDIKKKNLIKSFIKGDLLTCMIDKKLIFYLKEDKLYEYSFREDKSYYIGQSRSNLAWNHSRISIVNNKWIFFNDYKEVYRYDLSTREVKKEEIKDCNIAHINMKNTLLCRNRNYEENKPYFTIDPMSYKKEYIDLKGSRDAFYDKELNGIFYTRYDFDLVNMREYRPSYFYSIEEDKEYFLSKECHF
ncbi:MAG: Unknown protein [uncultured Sulfurovum sp.]|uniref:Uncharacterized protein n=1 Tax=uncultured Sulfurovum sp. TaxID=269237 RepID=A0A6S6TCT0_9BACT|nr:MAG: Unknown protein [uncultured Sulfurovum sp.]